MSSPAKYFFFSFFQQSLTLIHFKSEWGQVTQNRREQSGSQSPSTPLPPISFGACPPTLAKIDDGHPNRLSTSKEEENFFLRGENVIRIQKREKKEEENIINRKRPEKKLRDFFFLFVSIGRKWQLLVKRTSTWKNGEHCDNLLKGSLPGNGSSLFWALNYNQQVAKKKLTQLCVCVCVMAVLLLFQGGGRGYLTLCSECPRIRFLSLYFFPRSIS